MKRAGIRSASKLPIWKLHVGYLNERAKLWTDDDFMINAYAKSVPTAIRGLQYSISVNSASRTELETCVEKYVLETVENRLCARPPSQKYLVKGNFHDILYSSRVENSKDGELCEKIEGSETLKNV